METDNISNIENMLHILETPLYRVPVFDIKLNVLRKQILEVVPDTGLRSALIQRVNKLNGKHLPCVGGRMEAKIISSEEKEKILLENTSAMIEILENRKGYKIHFHTNSTDYLDFKLEVLHNQISPIPDGNLRSTLNQRVDTLKKSYLSKSEGAN